MGKGATQPGTAGGQPGPGAATRAAGAMAEVVPIASGNPCAVASGVPARATGRRG
jgi:hypothetical protein